MIPLSIESTYYVVIGKLQHKYAYFFVLSVRIFTPFYSSHSSPHRIRDNNNINYINLCSIGTVNGPWRNECEFTSDNLFCNYQVWSFCRQSDRSAYEWNEYIVTRWRWMMGAFFLWVTMNLRIKSVLWDRLMLMNIFAFITFIWLCNVELIFHTHKTYCAYSFHCVIVGPKHEFLSSICHCSSNKLLNLFSFCKFVTYPWCATFSSHFFVWLELFAFILDIFNHSQNWLICVHEHLGQFLLYLDSWLCLRWWCGCWCCWDREIAFQDDYKYNDILIYHSATPHKLIRINPSWTYHPHRIHNILHWVAQRN